MGFVGRGFKLFLYDLSPGAWAFFVLLALGAMWLGYRYSRPSSNHLSIRRPPPESSNR
jgi:hypothetical protein